ncbi:uncharacterized protein MKK02DRAFT_44071 [Dioszegia hungarica]|uniref:Uncharacterized protein n=1 Tax=Dioszegia hungarica TaxID=4972 RepID=A0AA38LV74_9TREE|nr:uncharacterized protein MKK02DRAFT_44071 [Dioszegia hungarica]KAI9635384.1 hypothetical protein MKK02DRAFT_44071 [Dioszegia hungarica]
MKGDNTFVQNQYGQDQVHPQQQQPLAGQGYNDSTRGYGQGQPQAYGAVGNMGAPQHGHHGQPTGAGGQPIYVVDDGRRQGNNDLGLDIVLYIIAFFVPPASVVVKRGCGGQFWLNILLTLLGGIPGLIHAIYIVAVTPGTYSRDRPVGRR